MIRPLGLITLPLESSTSSTKSKPPELWVMLKGDCSSLGSSAFQQQ